MGCGLFCCDGNPAQTGTEVRNPNLDIRNEFEIQNQKRLKSGRFGHSCFEIHSDFEHRIWYRLRRGTAIAGRRRSVIRTPQRLRRSEGSHRVRRSDQLLDDRDQDSDHIAEARRNSSRRSRASLPGRKGLRNVCGRVRGTCSRVWFRRTIVSINCSSAPGSSARNRPAMNWWKQPWMKDVTIGFSLLSIWQGPPANSDVLRFRPC